MLLSNNYPYKYATDIHSLKMLVEKYPYFSHAHFLLLKQLQQTDDSYNAVAAKTALHFANPFLLEKQLMQDEEVKDIHIVQSVEIVDIDKERNLEIEQHTIVSEEKNEFADGIPPVENAIAPEPNQLLPEEKQQVPGLETKTKEETLLFEPLHTTDYFASQGIKLSEAVLPNDKMGRQLRSFTDWLKTMKKVHPSGMGKNINDVPVDASVQNMAEKSNIEEDIVTESMAEVYLQQGKKEKAIEIYQKLSLLNPSKNAYFAAKINEIH
ncbi:MAG TPA: hypothetical protein PK504_07430 [Ferruginibacter sp.]|nr:hypothetical protein [Ferruginibacter sp.]